MTKERYFEQVIITKPDITLKAAGGVKPVITFYYGIGYKYRSLSRTGYYSEECAAQSVTKHYAKRWGAVVIVESSAVNFRAEDIYFENSFNLYMTQAEIEDGIESITSEEYGQSKCETNQERTTADIEVSKLENKERAAAVVCEADNAVFEGCTFVSSQDTLYAGHGEQKYIGCTIVGNVDYIFGEADARVCLYKCRLVWLGYTGERGEPGIICAPKGIFLFAGCRVEANKAPGYRVEPGYLARPWRASGAVLFYKCDIEKNTVLREGFTSMNGVEPEEAAFFEYLNTCEGEAFNTDRGKVF